MSPLLKKGLAGGLFVSGLS